MATITLGGNPIQTAGDLPANDTDLSNIKLTADDLSDFTLGQHAGKRIVLNVFPSIDTGVCATSVRTFNERAAALNNTSVVCVSKDLPFAMKRFCGAEGIDNVAMASDFRHGDFSKNIGVDMIDGKLSGLMSRAVIVLNEAGKVIYTEQVPEIGQEPNYDAVADALK
jgi:thiol peroxidase